MTAIKLENISYKYPKATKEALSQVNLEIPEGSFFALLGPNGAGKTTMLRLLCGRFGAFSGELKIDEKLRGPKGFLDPKSYGILLENPGVYPKLSIEEYVNYFVGFHRIDESAGTQKSIQERIVALSKSLELPALTTRLSALSLGNRQKVQLLRAMAHNPKLLILDEPVANLDPMSREAVWKLISDWRKQEGGTAVVCSHILAEMETEATDFAIIDGGRVLKQGRVNELAENTRTFQLELSENITAEQVRTVLEKAGFIGIQIKQSKSSLSELYRNTVQG